MTNNQKITTHTHTHIPESIKVHNFFHHVQTVVVVTN